MILVVDDDASVTASLGLLLRQAGYAVRTAASPAEALAASEAPSLVLQDMNFSRHTSGEEGLALLRDLRARWPAVPVVLMTAWGSIPLAVEGMKAGAADFVTKPWTNAQLLQSIRTAFGLAEARPAASGPAPRREELDERCDFGALVGEDPRFLAVLEVVARIAPTDASVLISGESGTGKELVAEAIHRSSRRQAGPFVKVNLGGIATSLFESEMFGHVRGAFTDARADRKGRFELADGGTVLLDEIGEVEPSAQVKLLRVLQDRTYEVLGSSVTRTVNVRVVSATNRDLGGMVARGQFREDLLYRINLISIHLPPLRERPGDVPLLAHRFLATFAQAYGRDTIALSPAATRWLQAQPWPGNVRQLRQCLERAVLVSGREVLEPADLETTAAMEPKGAPRDTLPPVGSMTLDEIERAMIVKSLRHHQGNLTRVAESLGMSRPALYRRLEKYGIEA
jgi:DNA-binding NtrC family response regulator